MTKVSRNTATYHHGNLREALIERAIETIGKSGVEAVSLRGLAREIGVSHAAPMRHFPIRSTLLAAIAEHGINSLLSSATAQADNAELTSLEKLQSMSNGYLAWVAANPIHHMLIRNQDVMRHADESLVNKIDAYARLHEKIIVCAQREGWRSEEPTRTVFLRLTALTAGLALIASDPIYNTVFKGRPCELDIRCALSEFFLQD